MSGLNPIKESPEDGVLYVVEAQQRPGWPWEQVSYHRTRAIALVAKEPMFCKPSWKYRVVEYRRQ